jgi:ABC-type multidrug transport system ATPase subunit
MGPSGCGKSTLLKALTGDNPATGGKVFLFGLNLIEHYKLLKKKIGYVPQEDITHRDLTVYETLYYAAKLRLDQSTTDKEIKDRINEVLSALNINNDNIIKTRVKSLSGGQRKRVSIAVELLNKPSILFLDEPTSPLDPETIEEFLKCIQALCRKGTTVIMVTHKPEDLNFADRLIFMGSNGYHVYDGSKEKILPYFQKSHIVEIYTLLSQKEVSQNWYQKWYSISELPRVEGSKQLQIDRDVNSFYQFKWLLKRNIAIKMGNPANLRLQVLQPIIISLLLILVFNNLVNDGLPTPGVIFMMNIAAIWFGVSNAAREIVDELPIYKRERMFNLKIGPYLCSKLTLLGTIGILQTFVLTTIIKLNYQAQLVMFGSTWLFLWLIFISGVILGLLISASAKNTESVMTILPIALLPQNILAGIVAPIDDKFTEILSFLTLGRWGTEGLARIQDKFESGAFKEHILDKSLYYDKAFTAFNSFQANIHVILSMNVIIIALTIYQLYKKDSIPS